LNCDEIKFEEIFAHCINLDEKFFKYQRNIVARKKGLNYFEVKILKKNKAEIII
jgi:hypothetical protein